MFLTGQLFEVITMTTASYWLLLQGTLQIAIGVGIALLTSWFFHTFRARANNTQPGSRRLEILEDISREVALLITVLRATRRWLLSQLGLAKLGPMPAKKSGKRLTKN